MANRVTRLLILHRTLRVSVEAKRALESTRRYEVAAYNSPDAALEHLRTPPPPDVIIVDFNLPRVNGRDIVLRMRAAAPDALIIATPDTPEVARAVTELKLGGVVDMPPPARRFLTVFERILNRDGEAPSETTESPPRGRTTPHRVAPGRRHPPPAPTLPDPPLPQPEPAFSSLDSVLVRVGGFAGEVGTETVDVDMSDADYADDRTVEFILTGQYANLQDDAAQDTPRFAPPVSRQDVSPEASDAFQRIAAEEPPPPTFEEGGTVSDLMIGVGDTNLQAVVDILRESRSSRRGRPPSPETPGVGPPHDLPETGALPPVALPDTAARHILENALDDTTPLTFSLDEFMERVKARGDADAGVQPLPSWEAEIDRYVREPAFLEPKLMPELHPDDPGEQPTALLTVDPELATDDSFTEADTANLPSSPVEEPAPEEPAPPPSLPEEPAPPPQTAPPPPATLPEAVEDPDEATLPPLERMVAAEQAANPEVARMALALTHASLEATAQLTLLARNGQIAGYGGEMPVPEIELLRRTLNDDWESTPEDARIRFVRVEQSGTDYVVYTRGSEGGYSLSLVFAGNLPLNTIRRQFEKLVGALQTVPQLPAQTGADVEAEIVDLEEQLSRTQAEAAALTGKPSAQETGDPAVPLVEYTVVWLVADPDTLTLTEVAHSLRAGLEFQLSQLGWQIRTLQIDEDYVYLEVGLPEELPPASAIAELKQRSGRILESTMRGSIPGVIWAQSYLALTPARGLDAYEIQRFINFARAR